MICNLLCPFFNNGYCKLSPRAVIPFGNQCINEDARKRKMLELTFGDGEIYIPNVNLQPKCEHDSDSTGKCNKCGIMVNKV